MRWPKAPMPQPFTLAVRAVLTMRLRPGVALGLIHEPTVKSLTRPLIDAVLLRVSESSTPSKARACAILPAAPAWGQTSPAQIDGGWAAGDTSAKARSGPSRRRLSSSGR